ncbi:ribulose-phosphate 3-epimerase [bacterium]|jgi:ribulose-phosphate 3-epimerase|nr:ribulose-phosphate 3-epimerase [bacterium]
MSSVQVSASVLSADFSRLGEEVQLTEAAGADSFHLDVMDGHMAPNLSFGPPIIKAIREKTSLHCDAHLMIDQPWLFIDDYVNCGMDSILIHAEAYDTSPIDHTLINTVPRSSKSIKIDELARDLAYIKSKGVSAGVTLNPGTSVACIESILDQCDSILIMSVNPGFSGQAFIPEVMDKVRTLRNDYSYTRDIKIDGGINKDTAPLAVAAGANVLISASYLYGSSDYKAAISGLQSLTQA